MRSIVCGLALAAAAVAMAAQPQVVAVDIDGVIHPITAEIVGNAIEQAQQRNAAVLVRLNTPGGLLDATRDVTQRIVASHVPVIAYVAPSGARAASAGFFVLESADVAAMAPGTNTGASSPVSMTGEIPETMKKKVENDTAAWLRSIVEKRGRDFSLAEKTVRDATAFSEREALDGKLIDVIVPTTTELLRQLDGREITRFDGRKEILHNVGAQVVPYQLTWRERIISSIADPNVGFVLLIAGALGVYVEFTAPGLILPGVAGGILVLLGLSSLAVLPINWIGASLLLLGIVLFILEAHFTSHGVLGVGGAVSMVLGAVFLVNGPPELRIHLSTALAVVLPFATITVFLLTLVLRARANKAITGEEGMVDEIGEARTPLNLSGKVFVHGEYWDAIATSPVEEGSAVRVIGMEGMKLRVEPK